MATSLGELFIELGVFADTEEVKKFEQQLKKTVKTIKENKKETNNLSKSIGNFIKSLRRSVLVISGALYAINRFTNSLIESNQQFLNLTRTSDISLSTFQKWNNIGKMFGVKNAAEQIAGLNERLFDLMLTGQGAEGFVLAGVNPLGQDAEGVIEQLRNRVRGLDDTAASYLLKQMGIDPTMLHLLRMGREEFEALGQTIKRYQLTEEQRAEIQQLNVQLQIANLKLAYLKDRILLAFLPIWTRFQSANASIANYLGKIGGFIDNIINKIPRLKEAIIGLGFVIMTMFQPIWALLTAIYLIMDDIAGYFEGKDSLTGHFINGLNSIMESLPKPIIKGLLPMFNGGNNSTHTNNYDNRQINVRADIQSNQPSFDIQREISSAQYAFSRY